MEQIKQPRIIIYDDENLKYLTGYCGSFETSNGYIETYYLNDTNARYIPDRDISFRCSISNCEKNEHIELDPTTMKRISKYNKEVEIEKLDEIIELKQKKIEELDDILQDKDQRVEKIREYIRNIYDIDISNDYEDEWDDEEDE